MAITAGAFCIRFNKWIEERFELSEPDLGLLSSRRLECGQVT